MRSAQHLIPCKVCGDPANGIYWELWEELVCSQRCLAALRDMQDADLREEG